MACGRKKSMPSTSLPVFPTSAVCPSIVARIAIPFAKSILGLFPFSRLSLVRFYSSLCPLFLHRADSECFFPRKPSELPCYAPLTSESGQIHFLNFICRKLYIVSMRTDLLRCILTFFSFIAQNFVCPLGYIFLQFQECHKIRDFQFLRYVYGCNDRETCCLRLNTYDRQSLITDGSTKTSWPAYSR